MLKERAGGYENGDIPDPRSYLANRTHVDFPGAIVRTNSMRNASTTNSPRQKLSDQPFFIPVTDAKCPDFLYRLSPDTICMHEVIR